jgi:dihydroorotate dehydrogenase
VPAILEGICQQLDRNGFRTISEAVGSGAGWR